MPRSSCTATISVPIKSTIKPAYTTEVQQAWSFAQGFLLPQPLHQHHLEPAPEILHTIVRTPLHPQTVMAVQRPAHQTKRNHHSQVDQLTTNNIAVDFSRRFHSPLALLMRRLPFGNVDWHIVTKQQIAGVEKIFALVRGQSKNARIHADSIARAGFDTEAAEHTAQFIDDERGRVFFYRRIRVFAGLNVNAQRWTRCGTEHTGGAAWRAVFFTHQAMAPAIALRDIGGLFRILLRDPGRRSPSPRAAG